jgi:hypothetical protein
MHQIPQTANAVLGLDLTFVIDDDFRANPLDHFENVRNVENDFPRAASSFTGA